MATRSEVDRSSDEDDGTEPVGLSLSGYQFEPQRESSDEESEENSDTSSGSSDEEQVEERNRLCETSMAWCTCHKCSKNLISSELECLCCKEGTASRAKAVVKGNSTCVTNHKDFETLCLHPAVLRNVLVILNNIRGDHWDTDHLSNRSFRYAAYRQYTWWIYGKIGKKNRRIIPSCVVHKIRETFPKADDEEYEGFHEAEDSD